MLITIGASTDKKLGLEGQDAEGIFSAVQFLRNASVYNTDLLSPQTLCGTHRVHRHIAASDNGNFFPGKIHDNVYIPCDILVVAIGQNIETKHFEDAGIPVNRGKIVTKNNGAIENLPGVFAGGSCTDICFPSIVRFTIMSLCLL